MRGITGVGLLSFVFYRSIFVFIALSPLGIFYPFIMKDSYRKKRQEELLVQFKDAILSLSACLTAGYSIENAYSEVLREVTGIYGTDAMITKEIRLLIHKAHLNHTPEEAMMDFAERSGLEDIKSFADVFMKARTSGGELMKIIARTADLKDIVKAEDIPFLAQSAFDDACRPGNPKATSVEDITKLYESLI